MKPKFNRANLRHLLNERDDEADLEIELEKADRARDDEIERQIERDEHEHLTNAPMQ